MDRTVVIAQARMSSTRLPGKTMEDLGGMPIVDHVVARARASRRVNDVWVATTTDATDDVLAAHLDGLGVSVVRGSLEDVLARYVETAEAARADTIVRITCDCPLVDPEIIDAVIEAFWREPEVDYCSNGLRRTYPVGMDVEVFTRTALEQAHAEAKQPSEREHVTAFMYQHPERFRLRNVEAPEWARRSEVRLTVDEPADLELAREIVSLAGPMPGLRAILAIIEAHPELAELNAGVAHRHMEKPTSW